MILFDMNSASQFYNLSAKSISGQEVGMNQFEGKVVLVVNTASKCGLTPQLEGLENLYRRYRDKGLIILGFPCNQFANQDPSDEREIAEFCQINYGVTFPMFAKVDVNGPDAHPVFKYLKKELPGILGGKIKWNFTKFLLDHNGRSVKRFSPATKPDKIESYLQKYLHINNESSYGLRTVEAQ